MLICNSGIVVSENKWASPSLHSHNSVLCQLLIYCSGLCHCSSHWPLSMEARVSPRSVCVGFVVDIGTGMGFPPSTSVYPVSIFPPMLHIGH